MQQQIKFTMRARRSVPPRMLKKMINYSSSYRGDLSTTWSEKVSQAFLSSSIFDFLYNSSYVIYGVITGETGVGKGVGVG